MTWILSWSSKDSLASEEVKFETFTTFRQLEEVYRAAYKNDDVLSPKVRIGPARGLFVS